MLEIEVKLGNNTSVWLRGSDSAYEICEMRDIAPRKGEPKKPTLTPYKYYSTLQGAISSLLCMKIRTSDARTMEDLVQVIKNSKKELAITFDLGN